MASLDDIMAERDAPAPSERDTAPKISDADRAANPLGVAKAERDRAGRFAQRTEKEPTEPSGGPAEGDAKAGAGEQDNRNRTVPQQALQAERQKRQERDEQIEQLRRQYADLERRVAAPQPQPASMQEPQKPPQFWDNPDQATDYRVRNALDPLVQREQERTLFYSQRFATQEHGAEAVQQAIQSLAVLRQSNAAEYQRLEALATKSMDPIGDVVRWHKAQRLQQEVGLDPEAYFQRRLAEWQAQQHQQEDEAQDYSPPAQQRQAPAPRQLPTAFAAQRGGGPRGGGEYGGPRALSEIMPRG